VHGNSLLSRGRFGKSDMRDLWIGKQAGGHQASARATIAAREIIPNDPEVILRGMSKLRTPGAFTDSPNIRRGRFEAIVHTDPTSVNEFDSR
jgi:hypothetical protein